MPATVITPTSANVYAACPTPLVFTKATWSDSWTFQPELRLVSCEQRIGSAGAGSCTIRRRYGRVKLPWESAFTDKLPWGSADGTWIRICVTGDSGIIPIWTGIIEGCGTDPHGSLSHGPSGTQEWVAHSAARILEKISVSRSYWWVEGADKDIGWIPDVNDRDKRGWIIGNRSAAQHDYCYLYGGTDVWTAYDYVEYLLNRFVDESDTGGPVWTIGGQTSILADLKEIVPIGSSKTVAELLKDLIPPRFGIDWTVAETATGFEIQVFALTPQAYTFGFVTLPANPNTVELTIGSSVDVPNPKVVTTNEHGCKRLRVVGKRMVICCSVWGTQATAPVGTLEGTLTSKWTSALQTEYKTGSSIMNATAKDHDEFRSRDRFRNVYQLFGATLAWNHNSGGACPGVSDDGLADMTNPASDYQNHVRRTLSWTPLKEGFDYTASPETDNNPTDHVPAYLPPALWVAIGTSGGNDLYQPAEALGISLSTSQTDWGFLASSSPNHLLALNSFDGAGDTETTPQCDYTKNVFTFAFESDTRMGCVAEDPDYKPSDGLKVIEVEDAELWFLAPYTVVGVDSSLALQTSGSSSSMLRSDASRLHLVMAGAIARYCISRARADVPVYGLAPWGDMVGQILTVLSGVGAPQWIGSPITSVSWHVPDKGLPITTVRAGYAKG